MAVAAITFLLTFLLNAMVGRDGSPDESEPTTVLLNLPEGTSLDGTLKVARPGRTHARCPRSIHEPVNHEGGLSSHSHLMRLKDLGERKKSNLEVAAEARAPRSIPT